MNIVVVDADNLAEEHYFPGLNLRKYGWIEYPSLTADEAARNCWRSDVIVTINMPLDRVVLDEAVKLRVVVVMNDDKTLVDRSITDQRGIQVIQVTGFDLLDEQQVQQACRSVMSKLNAMVREGVLG